MPPTRPRPPVRAAAVPRPWYHVGPVRALALVDDEPGDVGGSTSASTADVYVFDTIGGWFGLTAEDFVRDVAGLQVDQIVLHLNTPGGDATEGVAIANVLRAHRARIVVRVDGLAASAGSVIAMCGDEIVMGIGSQMMIHDAWGYAQGNAAEMAAAQHMLDSTSDAYAAAYAARAGGTAEEWRAVMRSEAWYTGDEAVAAGLADRVATADEVGTAEGEQITPGATSYGGWWDMWDQLSCADRFDLSAYRYAGRDRAPAPPPAPGLTRRPAASAAGRSTTERTGDMPFMEDVRRRLGVAADADEATVLAALDEALEERADGDGADDETEDDETETETEDEDESDSQDTGDVEVSTVDSGTLARLRRDAELGRAAHARQQHEDRKALVDTAVKDGRIAPAKAAGWMKRLAADPTEAKTLAGLERDLIPVGGERGHAGDGAGAQTAATVRESTVYKNWRM